MSKFYVYFDTNILINLYSLDADTIKKIIGYKEFSVLKPITTNLTIDEFYRNRKKVLNPIKSADSISSINAIKKHQTSKEVTSFEDLEISHRKYQRKLEKFKQDYEAMLNESRFEVDRLVKIIFEHAITFNYDKDVFDYSKMRYDLGYAPGKGAKYNDMVNWQTVIRGLSEYPNLNKVYFCVDDNDYLHYQEELSNEFTDKTNKEIQFINLNEFTSVVFKDLDEAVKKDISRTINEAKKNEEETKKQIIEEYNTLGELLRNDTDFGSIAQKMREFQKENQEKKIGIFHEIKDPLSRFKEGINEIEKIKREVKLASKFPKTDID